MTTKATTYDQAIEILVERLVDEPHTVPKDLHSYLRGEVDVCDWTDEQLIDEANREG